MLSLMLNLRLVNMTLHNAKVVSTTSFDCNFIAESIFLGFENKSCHVKQKLLYCIKCNIALYCVSLFTSLSLATNLLLWLILKSRMLEEALVKT